MTSNAELQTTASPARDDQVQVLLVEDDDGDAVLVGELLREVGAAVVVRRARSLVQAKNLVSGAACVLLDLGLPDSQGLNGLRQLLQLEPEAAIVVLTGESSEHLGEQAVRAGAQDYLVKGEVAGHMLNRVIRYAVERRRAEEAQRALHVAQILAQENARLERGLLPSPLLTDTRLSVSARCLPGGKHHLLGGDFYDVVETPDGIVHAVIGDVCGHGAAEAAIGVCLRVAWRSLVLAGAAPAALMGLLEQMLMAEREDDHLFVTLTHLVFGPGQRSVRVLRAGHPGLLLRTPGHVDLVEGPAGPAVGLESGACWPEQEVPLPPDSGLVLFTDGLFEGRVGPGRQRLGEEGLLAVARGLALLPPADFVDTLLDTTEAAAAPYGGLADDLAIVHLGWRATQ